MKSAVLLLTLALLGVALAGIIPGAFRTPNPNDIFKKVQFRPLRTLDYAEPEVEVDLTIITIGYHGSALGKVRILYPHFALLPVWRCRYSSLGLIRFYVFSFKVQGEIKEVKTAVETEESSASTGNDAVDLNDGFLKVSVEWAQQDPRISVALKIVIKTHWTAIQGRPLSGCWSKPVAGLYIYRFYFKGVTSNYEYHEDSEVTVEEGSTNYFTEVAPILTVTEDSNPDAYVEYAVKEFANHPAYPQIQKLLEEELGFFDENWLIKYAGVGKKTDNTLKLIINFKPFLLEQHYEAYYYGEIEKASLLKVDEKVFNSGDAYEKWQEIEDFSKFNAFKEANEYILSQFSWIRFYTVETAYAALHKKGRFIRLVYKGIEKYVDGGNQLNIVVYVDEKGCYFMDRNDFHATHLNSYGRNDWVSLFVETPEISKAKYYSRIVKFHQDIYPRYWAANSLVDIKFKEDLHVIQFKNPTNTRYNVLQVTENKTTILNKINWTLLVEDSPLVGRLQKYVRGKHTECSKIMFLQYFKNEKGTHFEISFLTVENVYKAVYVLYIESTDVFTHNIYFSFQAVEFGKHPLPKDVKESILAFIAEQDTSIVAVTSFVSISHTSFAIIGVSKTGRWQITFEWQEGVWVVVSKQPYTQGYYKSQGYPGSLAASATGFLQKMYPKQMGEGFVYVSIETKSVGVVIFLRLIYKIKGLFVEAVIKKVYGVAQSEVLYSWKIINGLSDKKEFGYGVEYNYSYNVDKALLYKETSPKVNLQVEDVSSTSVSVSQPSHSDEKSCPEGSRRQIFTGGCIVIF